MGDVASSLVSASTEELLRQAAAQEVKALTNEYRLALAQALFLSVLEEKEATKVVVEINSCVKMLSGTRHCLEAKTPNLEVFQSSASRIVVLDKSTNARQKMEETLLRRPPGLLFRSVRNEGALF